MVKVLAVYNVKGGVGKTSTAVNLAYLAARDGIPTLLWDLDPQGSASLMLDAQPRARGGLRSLLRTGRGLESAVCDTSYEGLSVIPAEFADRKVEATLNGERGARRRITRMLRPLEERFELVVLDCPPSVSIVSENILVAADTLLVPLIPTTLSVIEQMSAHRAPVPAFAPRSGAAWCYEELWAEVARRAKVRRSRRRA